MAQTMVAQKELGLRLHMLRYGRGWSLLYVEAQTGIPHQTLSRWERAIDTTYPVLERLSLLADLYGLTVARLLDPEPLPVELLGFSGDSATPDERGGQDTAVDVAA